MIRMSSNVDKPVKLKYVKEYAASYRIKNDERAA